MAERLKLPATPVLVAEHWVRDGGRSLRAPHCSRPQRHLAPYTLIAMPSGPSGVLWSYGPMGTTRPPASTYWSAWPVMRSWLATWPKPSRPGVRLPTDGGVTAICRGSESLIVGWRRCSSCRAAGKKRWPMGAGCRGLYCGGSRLQMRRGTPCLGSLSSIGRQSCRHACSRLPARTGGGRVDLQARIKGMKEMPGPAQRRSCRGGSDQVRLTLALEHGLTDPPPRSTSD